MEAINDAIKKEKSPMKKKSKAEEGKNENVIKFAIEIMGENLSKSDLESLPGGRAVRDINSFGHLHENS